jgi:tetrapyrrole methylase family protein/MazG family protein
MKAIDKLVQIMATLRSERGCPWDRQQTHNTLKTYIIEETYEVIDAIDRGNPAELKEELGDLLFQIIFHCQLASERGDFDLEDVCNSIADKMTHRHPHVFGNMSFETAEEVLRQWEVRKQEEGKNAVSLFEGIPFHLPALLKAYKVQARASKVGFDWQKAEEALPKLQEEFQELTEAMAGGGLDRIEEEIGDLLFSVVNVARLLKVNPEEALRKTVAKFISRFEYMKSVCERQGRVFTEMGIKELDKLWDEAKERV